MCGFVSKKHTVLVCVLEECVSDERYREMHQTDNLLAAIWDVDERSEHAQ